MPIPQVNDRIKEAPAVMLRAVFAGVGQLLLAADKVRARAAGTGWPPDRTAPEGQVRAYSRGQSLDGSRNGTVPLVRERATSQSQAERPLAATRSTATAGLVPATAEHPPARSAAATDKPGIPAEPAGQPAAPSGPAAGAEPAEPAAGRADSASATPPLPGYDDLTIPSLRARLRVLDAAALQELIAYEKAHAHRDEVITMFERRLAKITAG